MNKLTPTQKRVLEQAANGQLSATGFRFNTVHKLLQLELVEGVGTGDEFVFWATDKGREALNGD